MMRLILGMIHSLKMEDNQAVSVGLHFHPHDQWVIVCLQGWGAEGRALRGRRQES